jgi:hypothetical protein
MARGGYGTFYVGAKKFLAHRVAYELFVGPIPVSPGYHGTCVCHRCDVRACVNPEHLFLGTNADNLRDMRAKGRGKGTFARGEAHRRSKFADADIAKAREFAAANAGVAPADMAAMFGMSAGYFRAVIRGSRR